MPNVVDSIPDTNSTAPHARAHTVAVSARRELTDLSELAGIHGAMLATIDGFVVAHNLPDHQPEAP